MENSKNVFFSTSERSLKRDRNSSMEEIKKERLRRPNVDHRNYHYPVFTLRCFKSSIWTV